MYIMICFIWLHIIREIIYMQSVVMLIFISVKNKLNKYIQNLNRVAYLNIILNFYSTFSQLRIKQVKQGLYLLFNTTDSQLCEVYLYIIRNICYMHSDVSISVSSQKWVAGFMKFSLKLCEIRFFRIHTALVWKILYNQCLIIY